MQKLSICLSDIPKEKIKTGKNGKKYIDLIVMERQQPDNYGNDLTVTISQTEAERATKDKTVFIGGGKNYNKNSGGSKTSGNYNPSQGMNDLDNLPFRFNAPKIES